MSLFINYNRLEGLSIDSYRKPNAVVGDIVDLATAMTTLDEDVSCQLEGAVDALEDDSIWKDTGVSQKMLEELYSYIFSDTIRQDKESMIEAMEETRELHKRQ